MTADEWNAGWVRCLGVLLKRPNHCRRRSLWRADPDKSFLICLNPHHENIQFFMPDCQSPCQWQLEMDTRKPSATEQVLLRTGEYYDMLDHSAVMFCEIESAKQPPIDRHPEVEGPKVGQQLNLEHEVHPKPPEEAEKRPAEPAATKEELKEPEVKRKPRKKKS